MVRVERADHQRDAGVATHAVTLGLLFYAINLVVSLLGAPAFAVGGRRARTRVLA